MITFFCQAVRGTLVHTDPNGKSYKLNAKVASMFVRPRGWHLWEEHVVMDKDHVPAAFFDWVQHLSLYL